MLAVLWSGALTDSVTIRLVQHERMCKRSTPQLFPPDCPAPCIWYVLHQGMGHVRITQ